MSVKGVRKRTPARRPTASAGDGLRYRAISSLKAHHQPTQPDGLAECATGLDSIGGACELWHKQADHRRLATASPPEKKGCKASVISLQVPGIYPETTAKAEVSGGNPATF